MPGRVGEHRYNVSANLPAGGSAGGGIHRRRVRNVLPEPFLLAIAAICVHVVGPGVYAVAENVVVRTALGKGDIAKCGFVCTPVGGACHLSRGRRAQQHVPIVLVVWPQRIHPKSSFAYAPAFVEVAVMLIGVQFEHKTPLLQPRLAHDLLCLALHALQRRHHYRHQQGDNGDHHEKLYKCKPSSFAHSKLPRYTTQKPIFEHYRSITAILPYGCPRLKR